MMFCAVSVSVSVECILFSPETERVEIYFTRFTTSIAHPSGKHARE